VWREGELGRARRGAGRGEERIEAGGLEEDGLALAGLRTGFSRFGTFRVRKFLMGRLFPVCRPALAGRDTAREIRRFGRKLEDKTIDSGQNKRNWG
jgi:hypothetical protein